MDLNQMLQELDELFRTGQIDKVEDFLIGKYEQAEEERDFGARLCILNELIGFYRDLTKHEEAARMADLILATIGEAGLKDTLAEGTSLMNIANTYRFLGRYEESKQCYERVQEIYERLLEKGDIRWAGLYNNMSLLYNAIEDYQGAADSLQNALEIVKDKGEEKIKLAVTYTNLGQAYLRLQKWKEGEEALLEAERIFTDTSKKDCHYCGCANALGALNYGLGRYEESVRYYKEALENLKETVGITENYRLVQENLRQAEAALGTERKN